MFTTRGAIDWSCSRRADASVLRPGLRVTLSRPQWPIADGRIALVPIAPEHLGALEALANDPLVQRFTRVPAPFGRAEAEWWLGLYEQW